MVEKEEKKLHNCVQTSFGLIPEMPEELRGSELVIIAVFKKFGNQAELHSICMPHQLYVEKLNRILKEKDVTGIWIYPASKAFPVKVDGKKVWIDYR